MLVFYSLPGFYDAAAEERESESNFTPYLNETMPSDNEMAG